MAAPIVTGSRQQEFFAGLMQSQYWSPERRDAERRQNIARMLAHARDHVPFYRERLASIFRIPGEIDWSRWSEIPILTRRDLLEEREALQSRALPPAHGRVATTSTTGSTGASVTVSSSAFTSMVTGAGVFRGHQWHGIDSRKDLLGWAGNDPEVGNAPNGEVFDRWGPAWQMPGGTYRRFNRMTDVDTLLDMISRFHPAYLTTRPKSAQFLALRAMERELHLSLEAILGISTSVLGDERADCSAAFGARLVGQYGSKEAQNIAWQCPTGQHYHVNDEIVLLEIIDDQGRPCGPGQVGRVIVTHVFNYAQPLIRYDQGDLAVLGEPCGCGRTLTVIDRIVGRTTHQFRFPDGKVVSPIIPEGLRVLLNAQYWQIAQVAPLALEVRYVPFNEPRYPVDQNRVAEIIRARTHSSVALTFLPRASLPTVQGGKFIEYVYEVPDAPSR